MKAVEDYKLEELCLEITSKCLLNCIHCSSLAKAEDLDKHVIKKVIDEFEEMGGKELEISGGEPLLHPYIWEILDYCKNRLFSVTLYSTGLSHASTDEIVNKINVDKVAVGLYNKEIAKIDCYENTKKFIKGLREKGIEVTVHFVPMKQNYEEFDDIVEECEELGVKEIKILRLIPQGRALYNWKKIHLPEKELQNFLRKVSKRYSKVKLGNPTIFYTGCEGICKAGISTCLINPRGEVYPCPALKNKFELCAGNIYEKSLKDLWEKGFENSRKFKELSNYSYCLAPWINYSTFEEGIREIIG